MFAIIDQLHHRTNIEAHYNDDNDGSITAAETPRDRCHEYIGIRHGSSVVSGWGSVLFYAIASHNDDDNTDNGAPRSSIMR